MTQIFLVEDHVIMRQMLREYLTLEEDLAVCGEAGTAQAALDQIAAAHPDLVLIDVALPDMSGIDLVRLLQMKNPHLRLAILSGHREKRHVDEAFEAGAQGYILKGNAFELPEAIRRVMSGENYRSAELNGLDK
jgi:DNA-binding NarL/FixJ family response regulator